MYNQTQGGNMKLKELRGNISQKETALLLKVEPRTYANYENEKTQPDLKFLKDTADFYNVSLDYLLGHKTKNTLEIGHLSDIKKELINLIYSATDNDCKMLVRSKSNR